MSAAANPIPGQWQAGERTGIGHWMTSLKPGVGTSLCGAAVPVDPRFEFPVRALCTRCLATIENSRKGHGTHR